MLHNVTCRYCRCHVRKAPSCYSIINGQVIFEDEPNEGIKWLCPNCFKIN